MEIAGIFQKFILALALGLLVGFQREKSESKLGGTRTYPLLTIFGTLAAYLSQEFGGWVLGSAFLAMGAMVFMGNFAAARNGKYDPGLTSEMAMLVMFSLGAYITYGPLPVCLAIGGGVAILLHLKPQMHRFAGKIGTKDMHAAMQFALIALVILPVLPNDYYGPYEVWNPYRIWLMVVLIVGIGFGGYLIYKIFGHRVGTVAGGFIGGLISSTATTVSYSRISRHLPPNSILPVIPIMIASGVVYLRVLFLMGITQPAFLSKAWIPFCIQFGVFALLTCFLLLFSRNREGPSEMPEQENPTELKPAIFFAAVYALVLLGVAFTKDYFGSRGVYVVALISGLTDVDAITLSISQMVGREEVSPENGWKLIMSASLSNLVFKSAAVAWLGTRQIFIKVAIYFGAALAAGLALLWLL